MKVIGRGHLTPISVETKLCSAWCHAEMRRVSTLMRSRLGSSRELGVVYSGVTPGVRVPNAALRNVRA